MYLYFCTCVEMGEISLNLTYFVSTILFINQLLSYVCNEVIYFYNFYNCPINKIS